MISNSQDLSLLTRKELEMHYSHLKKDYENLRLENIDLKNTKTRQLDEIISLRTALSDLKTRYNDLYRYVFAADRDWLDRIFGKTSWIYNKRHHIQR